LPATRTPVARRWPPIPAPSGSSISWRHLLRRRRTPPEMPDQALVPGVEHVNITVAGAQQERVVILEATLFSRALVVHVVIQQGFCVRDLRGLRKLVLHHGARYRHSRVIAADGT